MFPKMFREIIVCVIAIFAINLSVTDLFGQDHKASPSPPIDLQVLDYSFDFVLLLWDDTSNDEAGFIIERGVSGPEFIEFDTISANSQSYVDYQVVPNTTYFYRVRSFNTDGPSEASNEVEVTIPAMPHDPPAVPTELNGEYFQEGYIKISWTDNSSNEDEFHVFRGSNSEQLNLLKSLPANTVSFDDYNILPETQYYYMILASNEYGYSPASEVLDISSGSGSGQTGIELSALRISSSSVQLDWTSNIDYDYYDLIRINTQNDTITYEFIATSNMNDSNLFPNTHYRYQVIGYSPGRFPTRSNLLNVYTYPSIIENRVSDSLIMLSLFSHQIKNIIPDVSYYGTPVNMRIEDTLQSENRFQNTLLINTSNYLQSINDGTQKLLTSSKLTGEITIECWIRSFNPDAGKGTIISLEDSSLVAFSLNTSSHFADESITYEVQLSTATTNDQGFPLLSSAEPHAAGPLHHVVFTHSHSGDEYIYLNGKKIAEGFKPSGFDSWKNDMRLSMADNLHRNQPYQGEYYMIALYNKALTRDQVIQNYYASPFVSGTVKLNPEQVSINLEPNPAKEEILILVDPEDSEIEITEQYFVMIADKNGRPVLQVDISENFLSGTVPLKLTGLKPGLYTLVIHNVHQVVSSEKLIILR